MKLQSMFPRATAKAGGILVADLFVAEEADDSSVLPVSMASSMVVSCDVGGSVIEKANVTNNGGDDKTSGAGVTRSEWGQGRGIHHGGVADGEPRREPPRPGWLTPRRDGQR